jgi:hypothetical protein
MTNIKLAPIIAMVDSLNHLQLAEAARELGYQPPATSASARRVDALGLLCSLLEGVPVAPGMTFPIITKHDYDNARREGDQASDTLARRHGGWRGACRAAASMTAIGARSGRANPWPHQAPTTTKYTIDEVIAGLCLYREQAGRFPTSVTYQRWVTAVRRRGGATSLRLPGQSAVYRHFPASAGGWRTAINAAQAHYVDTHMLNDSGTGGWTRTGARHDG